MPLTVKQKGKSLKGAILNCRELPEKNKVITIDNGAYFFEEKIQLTALDSGLTIKGSDDTKLYGGKRILDWGPKNDKWWSAKLPEICEGNWDFRMLIVNGRYADRARFPQKDYLIHETDFDVTWRSTYEGGFEREPTYEELTTLQFKKDDIPQTLVPENAEITVFHMWDESLVGVKNIDWENQLITFSNPSGWPPGAFAKHYNFDKRYIVWNTEEGLQKPGQWYLDRKNGELVYWPLADEDMGSIEIIAPILENLFVIGEDEGEVVHNISLTDMTISGTNAPLMSGAFGAKLFDGAISIRNARDCHLNNLSVVNVGAHGIKASGNNIKITSCSIHNAGAGAIRLTGSKALIHNNHIHHVGKTFLSAIALYVGATDPNVAEEWEKGISYADCTISHNELHDVPYAAICAGGKNLIIQKNLIYRAMQDLYDGAGIYITFCKNALVKNNFIKDIKDAPGAGTSAYYLDEKAVDCQIIENIEIDVPRPSHNHIASNNVFRNNFFIIKGKGRFTLERCNEYIFEKNVMIAEDGLELYDTKAIDSMKNNILFSGKGKLITKDLDTYNIIKEYELPLDNNNINTDPLLETFEDGVIRFAENSPARGLGIKAIDISDAGRIKIKVTDKMNCDVLK